MPDTISTYNKHSKDLVILGIDWDESRATVQNFVTTKRIPYPILLDSGSVASQFGVRSLPHHIFFNKDGKITASLVGQMSKERLELEISKAGR